MLPFKSQKLTFKICPRWSHLQSLWYFTEHHHVFLFYSRRMQMMIKVVRGNDTNKHLHMFCKVSKACNDCSLLEMNASYEYMSFWKILNMCHYFDVDFCTCYIVRHFDFIRWCAVLQQRENKQSGKGNKMIQRSWKELDSSLITSRGNSLPKNSLVNNLLHPLLQPLYFIYHPWQFILWSFLCAGVDSQLTGWEARGRV